MDVVINQVAIWQPCGAKKLHARKMPVGIKYREPNGVIYKIANKVLTRYAKDYTIGKTKFSLFIRTDSDNDKAVESFMDACAKNVTGEYVKSSIAGASIEKFEYTPYIFGQTQFTEEK